MANVTAASIKIENQDVFFDEDVIANSLRITGASNEAASNEMAASYAAGSIYTDSNWGMILRAKTTNPGSADFLLSDSADRHLMKIQRNSGAAVTLAVNGTAPTAWANNWTAIHFGDQGSLANYPDVGSYWMQNIYYNGTSFKYIESDFGIIVDTGSGCFRIRRAASGTAGDTANVLNSMFIDTAGKMGLGLTNPSTQLHLSSSAPDITYTDTDGGDVYVAGNNGGQFRIRNTTDSRTDFNIDGAGNVGIGTAAPQKTLHVHEATSSTSNYIRLSNDATGSGANDGTDFGLGTSGNVVIWNKENTAFHLATNNTERLHVTATGRVGIGTTNPGTLFHVHGGSGTGVMYISTDSAPTGSIYSGLWLTTGYSGGSSDWAGLIFDRGNDNLLRLVNAGSSDSTLGVIIDAAGQVGIGITPAAKLNVSPGVLRLNSQTGGTGTVEGGEIQFNRGSDNTPFWHLDVYGTATDDSTPMMRWHHSGASRLQLDSSGYLTTPAIGSPLSSRASDSVIVYRKDFEEYLVDPSGNANFTCLAKFRVPRAGTLRVKFQAYIQAGSYWWAYRLVKNATAGIREQITDGTVLVNGGYRQVSSGSSSVHAYRNFSNDVTGLAPGDTVSIALVSSDNTNPVGTAVNGSGSQKLYLKDVRVYGTTNESAFMTSAGHWNQDFVVSGEMDTGNTIARMALFEGTDPHQAAGVNHGVGFVFNGGKSDNSAWTTGGGGVSANNWGIVGYSNSADGVWALQGDRGGTWITAKSLKVGASAGSPSAKVQIQDTASGTWLAMGVDLPGSGATSYEGGMRIYSSSGTDDRSWAMWADAHNPRAFRIEYSAARSRNFGDTGNGVIPVATFEYTGKVGIGGETTPVRPLEVPMGGANTPAINIIGSTHSSYTNRATISFNYGDSGNAGYIMGKGLGDDTQDFYLYDIPNNFPVFYANSTGDVGIGTTAPTHTNNYRFLQVHHATNGGGILFSDGSKVRSAIYNGDNIVFWDVPSDGYIDIRFSGSALPSGTTEFRFEADGDFHADGNIVAYSGTTASDIALKKNVTVIDHALDKVSQLKGVLFDWKREEKGSSAGVIAQDVEKVLPSLVTNVDNLTDDSSHKGVNYNGIIGLLVESIKELKKEIEELKND